MYVCVFDWFSGGFVVDKVLEKVLELFKEGIICCNVRKVFVVIIDNELGFEMDDIVVKVKFLEKRNVCLIIVVVGDLVN